MRTVFAREGYFLSQPHQPFFLAGIVWSVVAMILFWLGYRGIWSMAIDPTIFHAYAMLFIVFSHFFHGFLFTTFPRFCMTPPMPQAVYLKIFLLYGAGSSLFFAGALFFAPFAPLGAAMLFAGHLIAVAHLRAIYLAGTSPEKSDPFWLLVAHGLGLAAHALFVMGLLGDLAGFRPLWFPPAAGAGTWLYLVFLTFVVGQRMIPFFSHVAAHKPRHFIATVLALLALKTVMFVLGAKAPEAAITLALGLYLLKIVWDWRLPAWRSPAILWILHLGLFWLPAGLMIDALTRLMAWWWQTDFHFLGLHLAALGFVTTILIGFGTRVTLGHSGRVPHADRIAIAIFWLAETVVVARLLYSLATGLGGHAGWLFDLSAWLWITLFGVWGHRYGPMLLSKG
jgi:uncharacterized protein involved in response to NO